MLRYTLKRLAQMIALLLAISIIIFVLFAIMPGDFYSSNMRLSPERLAQLRAAAGLDKPIWQRYLI